MWGNNSAGQLCDGTRGVSLAPKKIMENISSVSLGNYHYAAITKNGDLYMWGNNKYGQIGDETSNICGRVPKKVESLKNVVSVSVGDNHSAALTKDGDLYMWGRNNYGQLGDGTTTDSIEPKLIMSNVISVCCGPNGNTAVITQDNDLYVFGYNHRGQFGDKNMSGILLPKKLMSNVASVSLGNYHTLVLTKDSELYAFGNNGDAQIGNGEADNNVIIPYTTPYKVMDNVDSINASCNASGALTKDGDLYTWGDNFLGECGNGSEENKCLTPEKILSNVDSFNFYHASGSALTKEGQIYVWGYNGYWQLGTGDFINRRTPTPVSLNLDNSTKSAAQTYSTSQLYSVTTPQINGVDTNIKNFTNLLPNSTYNFYIMKSKDDEDALNIIYSPVYF